MPWTYVIEGLSDEVNVETFYDKELQKTNETETRTEKVIKSDKFYVRWKFIILNLIAG